MKRQPLVAGGTITFQDLDLTDTHTATFVLKSSNANANLPSYSEAAPLGQIGAFSLTAVSENPRVTNVGSIGWSFALNNSDPVLQSLAVGQTITQVYTVTFNDHHGGTVTQDVTVTITGTNDAPTIVAGTTTASGGVTEDAGTPTLSTGGTIAIQDLDLIDTHTATWEFKASASNVHLPGFNEGSTQIGAFTIDPSVTESASDTNNLATLGWNFALSNNNAVLQSLALGQTITQVYTVTFDDHHGGTIARDVTVTITGNNDAPTVTSNAAAASGAVIEDAGTPTLSTGGTIAIQDIDLIDTHTAIWEFKSSASNEHLPGFDEDSTHIGTFTIDASVTEIISNTNDGATLGWSFTLDNNDAVLQSLALGQTITQVYTVTFTDNNGASVPQDVTVTITGSNDAPEIDAIAATPLDEKTDTSDLTATIGVTFTDVDLTDIGHTATITHVTAGGDIAGLDLSNVDLIALVKAENRPRPRLVCRICRSRLLGSLDGVRLSGGGRAINADLHGCDQRWRRRYHVTGFHDHHQRHQRRAGPDRVGPVVDHDYRRRDRECRPDRRVVPRSQHCRCRSRRAARHRNHRYDQRAWPVGIFHRRQHLRPFLAVPAGSALLLAATDMVRFVPDGEDGGTDTFTYVAWDQTTGDHGTVADVSASGGSTASL